MKATWLFQTATWPFLAADWLILTAGWPFLQPPKLLPEVADLVLKLLDQLVLRVQVVVDHGPGGEEERH